MGRPSLLPVHPVRLTLDALKKHKQPMSAYALLAAIKPFGVKAAPVVYRALEALMQSGKVHKIRTLNAFIACNCKPDHTHNLSVLTVCHGCERVEELHDHAVIHQLENLRVNGVPLMAKAVIELPVVCAACAP